MAKPTLRAGDIRLGMPDDEGARRVPDAEPFRILLQGDFRGGSPVGKESRPVEIDRDNFTEVLSQWRPSVSVPLGTGESAVITFAALEDFEPDHLYRTLPAFASLLALRKKLHEPTGFAAAKDEIQGWGRSVETVTPAEKSSTVSSENLLEQMLQKGDLSAGSLIPGFSEWDRFIRDTVAPYVIAAPDPRLGDYEKVVDGAIAARMRTILHHPDYQALEAIWRGLYLTARSLDTDERLKLFVLDVSFGEMKRDLSESTGLAGSDLYRHWVTDAKEKPWAVIAGHYSFGPTQPDLELLGNLAQLAAKAGVTFLAAGRSSLLGSPSFGEDPDPDAWQLDAGEQKLWEQLQQFPPAAHVALAMPRFLLRLPYGEATNSIESFRFEEWLDGRTHENYLWGNPAFLCALLLGQSYSQDEWAFQPGSVGQIEDLPVHVYDDDGERTAKPVAELALRDDALDLIIDAGLMPLLSAAGRDTVRVGCWQSIAGGPLLGRWTG